MQAAAKEARTRRSRAKKSPEELRAAGEADIKEAIEKLTPEDQALSNKLHALVSEVAPELVPRTYYGMPAWGRDGKVLCFFQPASKFKVRYGTFGFRAHLEPRRRHRLADRLRGHGSHEGRPGVPRGAHPRRDQLTPLPRWVRGHGPRTLSLSR